MITLEWDEAKRQENLEKHGVDFALAEQFEWKTALVVEDDRFDYGEIRWQGLGMIGNRLHMLVFTLRSGAIRVISLRKASHKEVEHYGR